MPYWDEYDATNPNGLVYMGDEKLAQLRAERRATSEALQKKKAAAPDELAALVRQARSTCDTDEQAVEQLLKDWAEVVEKPLDGLLCERKIGIGIFPPLLALTELPELFARAVSKGLLDAAEQRGEQPDEEKLRYLESELRSMFEEAHGEANA